MLTYQDFCSAMHWPAAQHFVGLLTKLVPTDQAVVFLAAESKASDGTAYDVFIMDNYRFIEARFKYHDDVLSKSNVTTKVHARSGVSEQRIEMSEFNAMPVGQGYSDLGIIISFKDGGEPIRISAKHFRLSQEEFRQVAADIAR